MSKNSLKIFWERDTRPYSSAQDFFRVLFKSCHITVLCENGDVQKNSILNVLDSDGSEYEITV